MRERALPGSERARAPEAAPAGPLDATTRITVTLVLRRRHDAAIGADPADVSTVTSELSAAGLQIDLADAPSRRVRASGTAEELTELFGTELEQVTSRAPDGEMRTHRQRTGALHIPEPLADIVLAVLGLDDRPQTRAHFRLAADPNAAAAFTPPQLGTIYRFPDGTDGSGQSVAIIELGGGYNQSDLDTYFAGLGLPTPSVTVVGVDGAANQPTGDPRGPDGEVALDVEIVGALAPGAAQVVYFAPNTDAGFVDALSEAIHASTTPVAISISWGQSEDAWTAQARTALDSVLADAATLGITVSAAAGDNGSTDGASDGRNHVDFPASSLRDAARARRAGLLPRRHRGRAGTGLSRHHQRRQRRFFARTGMGPVHRTGQSGRGGAAHRPRRRVARIRPNWNDP